MRSISLGNRSVVAFLFVILAGCSGERITDSRLSTPGLPSLSSAATPACRVARTTTGT